MEKVRGRGRVPGSCDRTARGSKVLVELIDVSPIITSVQDKLQGSSRARLNWRCNRDKRDVVAGRVNKRTPPNPRKLKVEVR